MTSLNPRNALDIETGPQALEDIQHLKPAFKAPSNFKDPDKVAANIAEQEAKWLADAALSPITGYIVCIGIKPFGGEHIILEGNERDILVAFWEKFGHLRNVEEWCGHGIQGFDLPFIIKRSWVHGLRVPMDILFPGAGRYLNDRRFLDTMRAFQCGDNRADYVGLDTVAKFFGLEGKTEDLGAQFAATYYSGDEGKARALAYLCRDLDLVEGIVTRMIPEVMVA